MSRLTSRELLLGGVAVLAVILNSLLGFYNVRRMMESEQAIRDSQEVAAEFAAVLSDMKDAETGHRGYLLTEDESFLQPFHQAEARVGPRLAGLQTKVRGDEVHLARIAKLERLIALKFTEMRGSIEIRKRQGLAAAANSADLQRGKKVMDELRDWVRDARDAERHRLVGLEEAAGSRFTTARFTTLVAAVLAIGIMLAAGAVVREELKRRRAATEQAVAALAQLRESESQFRDLAEAMPQIVWTARPDGFHDYNNSRWYDYTGTVPEQSLGFRWSTTFHPEDRPRAEARWAHSIRSGEPYENEHRIRRGDGVYRWYLGRAVAVRVDPGRVTRWLGTCTDIDDNKRLAETLERTVEERTAALVEQRTFLDTILNDVREGIVACDADGRLLCNRAAQELFGLPSPAPPAERWKDHYRLFEADGTTPLPPEREPLPRAWKGETIRDFEMIVRTTAGTERYLVCSGQPLVNAAGRTFGAVISMRDLTERRANELELAQSAKRLLASNEDLEKFAYIASHDLQEPLRKIQAFGDRLQRNQRERFDDEGRDSLDRMLDAASRMRRLIEDLLAFSRVSTRGQPFEPVNLNSVVREAISVFDHRLHQSGGRVTVEPLPTLTGDASQLRQLFQNLIGNALKFAKSDVPPEVTITVQAWADLPGDSVPLPPAGSGWRITVADNGIGFEQQYADRIFELFQRLHGRQHYEGTGLGLAICRKIAAQHGAAIAARGEPGRGAEFIIDWPQSIVSEAV